MERGQDGLDQLIKEISRITSLKKQLLWRSYDKKRTVETTTYMWRKLNIQSCKLIPVLLLNVLLYRRKFSPHKYLVVSLVTIGISMFMFFGPAKKKGGEDSIWGLGLLVVKCVFCFPVWPFCLPPLLLPSYLNLVYLYHAYSSSSSALHLGPFDYMSTPKSALIIIPTLPHPNLRDSSLEGCAPPIFNVNRSS